MSGPLSTVLEQIRSGAGSLDEVARRTGLDREVVRASVDHLVRMGRLETGEMSVGCPTGGCSSCASGSADGSPSCGSAGPSAGRRGPVLVQLRTRR